MGNNSMGILSEAERDLKKPRNKLPDLDSLVGSIGDLSIEPKPFEVKK
jgi:hypothetical protein